MTSTGTKAPRPATQVGPEVLDRIARRALAYCAHMIWEANHRADAMEGDPKVGGHPASCASSLHIASALHLLVRHSSDYYCAKPHLAPMDHALNYLTGFMRDKEGSWMDRGQMEAVMHNLRKFSQAGEPVFQSYHAEADPDSWRILPSGTVGIPPVCSAYLALAYEYAADHGYELRGQKHFWSLMGDSEFREGSLMEALPDIAERELGNVTWIVDYNRQNLDGTRIPNDRSLRGTDADRIERTCAANGWSVIQLRHGKLRDALFERPGGDAFRTVLEKGLNDYTYQGLVFNRDSKLLREELLDADKRVDKFLKEVSDDELAAAMADLGGHDIAKVTEALYEAEKDKNVPAILVAHTVKGWGLDCYAAPGNHSALPTEEEIEQLLASEGLTRENPYDVQGNWDADGPELAFLEDRGATLRKGVDGSLERLDRNAEIVVAKLKPTLPLPIDFGLNTAMVPYAHTQWAWGQVAGKLVRVGTDDELREAGLDAGRELSEDEQQWAQAADFMLTMSPDVGTSTNINPAMNAKVYGPAHGANVEKEMGLVERGRPELHAHEQPWTRHIRFEIAEANCMSAVGAFGKMRQFTGVPFLPMMTVYDFFIKRALDQLYYNLYWGSSFILMGTPSGVTLSPEGAQHSWKSDIQIPNLITWEPVYAKELDWILADAVRRHLDNDVEDRCGVLIRCVTRGVRQKEFLERLRAQQRFQRDGKPVADDEILASIRDDVLAGGYRLIDYRGMPDYDPGDNVVHILTMGSMATEAIAASDRLREVGVYADVIVVTSADLLLGRFAQRDDYTHLNETLGLDGALHLSPQAAAAAAGAGLDAGETGLLAARTIPIVSVADGEAGLLDNAGSILGVPQEALAVQRFSKSGRPVDIYRYQSIDAEAVFDAAGRVLSRQALRAVRLSPSAIAALEQGIQPPASEWRALWPFRFARDGGETS